MKIWKAISEIGVQFGANPTDRRYIQICNRVSLILFLLVFQLFLVTLIYFQWITSTRLALVCCITFLIPSFLNHLGFINASRLLLIFLIIIPSLAISVADKFEHPSTLEDFEYFQYRIILLSSCILPFVLFSLKEKANIIFSLSLSLLVIAMYDPVHNWFDAGYYQMGFTSPNYYFINYITIYSFFVLTGSTYFLKYSFEKSENENQSLIEQLSERQKEILAASQLIKHQRETLAQENRQLNKEVIEKNNQLTETNQELIRHNNDLQQYSYTVSHNLRGPVASLKGLFQVFDYESLNKDNQEIFRHLKESVNALDTTIKDLSNIIDIKNDITRIRQKLSLKSELDDVLRLLKKEIKENQITIKSDFEECPYIYSVRPMFHSILYNLISNAIKYRSPERKPFITVSATATNDHVKLTVTDNGIGIDLQNFGDKLFGLYKRFHTHTEGKGIGLFLVKLQVEVLDGKIGVESILNQGTKFNLEFQVSANIEEQILLDNEYATVYFNAPLNCLGINWKQIAPYNQSKELLQKSIDFIKDYQTQNWISNITRVIQREEKELNRFRKNHSKELKKAGLKRIGIILPAELIESDFVKRKELENVYDVDLQVFSSITNAKKWIETENEKAIVDVVQSPI